MGNWYYKQMLPDVVSFVAKDWKSEKVTSMVFCKKHDLKSPSTVQSALRVLHDKGVLRKEGDSYSVANRLLGVWVKGEY